MSPGAEPPDLWLRQGARVLRFRASQWDRSVQRLEVIQGEHLQNQPIPLLRRRRLLERQQARELWRQLRREGWQPCPPQW